MGLLAASGVTIYGGVTGRLAPMLGAVFAPDTLTLPQEQPNPSVVERLVDAVTPDIVPDNPLDFIVPAPIRFFDNIRKGIFG